jgi:hypothetical protein
MVIMLSVCQANGDNVLQTMGIRERLGMILAMCLPFVMYSYLSWLDVWKSCVDTTTVLAEMVDKLRYYYAPPVYFGSSSLVPDLQNTVLIKAIQPCG